MGPPPQFVCIAKRPRGNPLKFPLPDPHLRSNYIPLPKATFFAKEQNGGGE